jgi:hypothetical protein
MKRMKLLRHNSAILLVSVSLGACVAAGPSSDNTQLLPPLGGVVSGYSTSKGSLFGPFSSLNDDCTVQSHARVRILQKPAHGEARVVTRQGQAAFAASNAFARCNGTPITGTFVDYTPKPGYAGPERFRFEIIFRNGERRMLTPEFTVQR